MRITRTFAVTIEWTEGDWYLEYGPQGDVKQDFEEYVNDGLTADNIAAAIMLARPAMDGHITATSAADLSGDVLVAVIKELQAREHQERKAALLAEVRRLIIANKAALDGQTPIAVVFPSNDYENGWFLESQTVYLVMEDKTIMEVGFFWENDAVETGINDGPVGPTSALSLDLRTGDMEFDDYEANIWDALGVPTDER